MEIEARQIRPVAMCLFRNHGQLLVSRSGTVARPGSEHEKIAIMKIINLGILLAMVLILLCVPVSFSYVAPSGSTGTSVPIKEPSDAAVLGQRFQIKYGQELTVKGQNLKVKFDSLLDDSRCPSDVKCVWEGDAKILISVRRANASASTLELHTSANFKQAGKYQRYVIKLVALDPYPKTRGEKKQSDYVATLLLKKE